jgi:hypothetical protein
MDHISNIKAKQIIEGISGQYIHGDQTTFGVVEVKKGSLLLEMTIGGETMTLKPGNFHVIHSNVPHSAVAHADCKLIDVFSPVRQDYL